MLLFLDTETTGLGECRLVELAWCLIDGEIRTIRVKPPIPIGEEAARLHGIKDTDVAGEPPFALHPDYLMIKSLVESSVVVAHNAAFDADVLAREGISVKRYIDTKKVARSLYRGLSHYNLQALRDRLELEVEGKAHTAGGDVAVLVALFKRMLVENR